MSVAGRPAKAAEPDKDWEDEYVRLRAQFTAQKQLCNEQEEHIRKLLAKTRKIESDFALLERQQRTGEPPKSAPRNREEENLIATLYEQISKLKSQVTSSSNQNKSLTEQLEKKKREAVLLKRQVSILKAKDGVQGVKAKAIPVEEQLYSVPKKSMPRAETETPRKPIGSAAPSQAEANAFEIAKKYKARLDAAEEQLSRLRDENASLRSGTPAPMPTPPTADLQTRDLQWRLQQLQTQYDHSMAKNNAQSEAYKLAEEQIEEYAQRVRELRRALEDLRHEKDIGDIKANRVEELEDQVMELRQANRSLEDKIARLCEAPFISDAFGQHDARLGLEEAARDREEYRQKIDHLQEAVKTHYSALVSLNQQAEQLRQEKLAAEQDANDLRAKYSELEMGASLLQDKLRLYSGEDGVNLEDLERALTVVKRRGEAAAKLDFLENPDGQEELTMPQLTRKLQDVQVMNLSLMKEVERLEGMLKMQSKTNKDLHKELEMMVHKKDKDQRDAAQRTEEFEELALRRLHKIHSLEAQLRQYVYDIEKKNKKGRRALGDASIGDGETVISEQENALLSALIDEKNGNVEPDDNMLEVWVKGATIKEGAVAAGSSTFIVIDFFDYESQATGLIAGNKPTWDFAVSFKIKVDDFMIRHLATDVVTFELNLASQGDFTMLARCTVPLSPLLKSKPIVRLKNQPMLSVGTGEIIAHVQLDIKLALPLSELYRLYLERHPSERKHIEEIASKRAIENANATEKAKLIDALAVASVEDESRLFNELEVAIFNVSSLPKGKGNALPTPYVHFQLLGHPDKFTNPVADTIDPTFNERFIFPMLTNEQQMRLLRRSNILLSVIDMKGEERDDDSDGFMGEVNVSLASLAEGIPINDSFHVKNSDGIKVGTLRMSIRWKNTFRKPRELGPKALSGLEVECLISSFSPGDEKDGLVDYRAFMRFANPPPQIRTTIDKVRGFISTTVEREGLTAREILQSITKNAPRVDEESFLQCFVRLDIPLLPEDYLQLFEYIDMDQTNSVSVDQIVAVLNMDEVAGIPMSLQEKISIRMRNLEARGINPITVFEDADQWGDRGMLTRLEFKRALHGIGFMLVDETGLGEVQEIPSEPLRDSRKTHADQYDMLNDSMSSTEGDLLMHSEGGAARGGVNREHVEMERRRRETFEEKLAEVQKRSRDLTKIRESRAAQATAASDSERDVVPTASIGKNILAESPRAGRMQETPVDPFDGKEHCTSLSSRDTPIKGYDCSVLEESATKLQSRFRGYATRKKISPHQGDKQGDDKISEVPVRPYVPGIASRASRDDELKIAIPGRVASFSDAEATLRHCLETLEGGQPMPNLFGMFQTVDAKQLSYVNRKQFAYVIRQFDSLKPLTPEELRVFMDYFDISNDGSKIDYVAFCRFSLYKSMDMIPPVRNLQRIVFTPDSILRFRSRDTTGTGYLNRQDMLASLNDLGHGHFSHTQALAMLSLFETKADGLVNYSNFVEYIRSTDLSLLFDQADNRLRTMISGTGDDEANLRRWFRRLDRTGVGIITADQLAEAFAEHDLKYPLSVIAALLGYMDHNQNGVSYTEFAAWYKTAPNLHAALYSSLLLAEVQKKAALYIRLLTQYNESAIGSLSQGFLIYDWRKPSSGMIGKDEFITAVFRSGFVFTPTELKMLSREFASESNPNCVVYKDFLSWCVPSDAGAAVRRSVKGTTRSSSRRNAAQIIELLETMLRRGTDLLSVFGRYDGTGVGRITSDEFCAALSDLGLSSVTQAEALEAADTFKAAAGGFVLYRRVVTELLNQMDYATKAHDVDAIDIIRAKLQKHDVRLEQLRDVFEYYDRKHIGRIPESDLGIVFEECRMPLKRHELQAIVDRFCVAESGWIQYLSIISALEARISRSANPSIGGIQGIPEELVNRVSSLLESLILRGKDFRSEFDSLDDKFMGAILQSDFRDLLQDRFRAAFTERDLETLEKHYRDTTDPRKVNHVRLLHELHPRNAGSLGSDMLHVLQIADVLRQKIRKRCDYLVPGELRRPYRHFARRKIDSGFSREDMVIALKDLGIQLAGDQEKQLFSLMSYDDQDKITFNMFVVFVCDPFHQDVIWKLRREIARARISDAEIVDALDAQDTNASALITPKQFLRAMKSCNISLSDNDVTRLMYRFDDVESQRFDIEKFTNFLRGQPENSKIVKDDISIRDSRGSRHGDMEGVELRVVDSLKNRIEDKLDAGFTHAEVFALFDVDLKGIVDLVCLQRGARELGVNMSRAEARGVLRRLSLNAGGAVDKLSFFESLGLSIGGRDTTKKRHRRRHFDSDDDDEPNVSGRRSGSKQEPTGSLRRILASIRRELDLQADELDRAKALRRALQDAAHDRDGLISRREFVRAVEMFDRSLTARDGSTLFEFLDANSSDSGILDINYAVDEIVGEPVTKSSDRRRKGSKERKSSASRVFTQRPDLLDDLKKAFDDASQRGKKIEDLHRDMEAADHKRRGVLSGIAFADCLRIFGLKLRSEVERDLCDSLMGRDDTVDYEDFIGEIENEMKEITEADDLLDEMRRKIRKEVTRGSELSEIFDRMDRDRNGTLTLDEFNDGLKKLGIHVSRAEAKRITERFSARSGGINYRDFLRALFPRHQKGSQDDIVVQLIERFRVNLQDRIGSAALTKRRVKQVFDEIDANGDGSLSTREFKQAMRLLNVDMPSSDLEKIMDRFDRDGNGQLQYREFVDMLGGAKSLESEDVHRSRGSLNSIVDLIRRKLEDNMGSEANSARRIKEVFAEVDADGSSSVDKREFRRAMRTLKIDLGPDEVEAIFAKFDKSGDGHIDYGEFLDLLGYKSAGRSRSRESGRDSKMLSDTIDLIRRKLEDNMGSEANSARRIKEVFAEVDADGSSSVDKREFRRAMRTLKIDLGPDEVEAIFAKFDKSGDGHIDYGEFLDLLGYKKAASSSMASERSVSGARRSFARK